MFHTSFFQMLNEFYLDAFFVQKYLVECYLDAFLLRNIWLNVKEKNKNCPDNLNSYTSYMKVLSMFNLGHVVVDKWVSLPHENSTIFNTTTSICFLYQQNRLKTCIRELNAVEKNVLHQTYIAHNVLCADWAS